MLETRILFKRSRDGDNRKCFPFDDVRTGARSIQVEDVLFVFFLRR